MYSSSGTDVFLEENVHCGLETGTQVQVEVANHNLALRWPVNVVLVANHLKFYPANKKEKHVFCLRVILRMKALR